MVLPRLVGSAIALAIMCASIIFFTTQARIARADAPPPACSFTGGSEGIWNCPDTGGGGGGYDANSGSSGCGCGDPSGDCGDPGL